MPENTADLLQRFVADLGDVAIILLDAGGHILSWNEGARALLGYSAAETVGRNFSDLHSKLDLQGAAQSGRHEASGQMTAKDGGKFQVRVLLKPLIEPGQGLRGFGMVVLQAQRETAAASGGNVVRLAGKRKILVVDDNDGLLEEVVDKLARLGYAVRSASNGAAALAVLQHEPDVELLFTDVVMPGEIAGRVLADRALALRPGLKVLFASGYFEGALVSKGDLETDVQFIAKPYRMKELAQKIEQVLTD